MNLYKIEIRKPFDVDILNEKVKSGDVGIYAKHIMKAIKDISTLEITTPFGVAYADPRKIKKERRIIYRYYLKPEPMLLYVYTPIYNNRESFEEKQDTSLTKNGASKLLSAYRDMLKGKKEKSA